MDCSIKLVKKEEAAQGTFSFYFSKPAFSFTPGQYVEMKLDDMPYQDQKGNQRYFSIASAPHEDHLMFATRMRDSAFKKTLSELSPGKEVKISSPQGNFTLDDTRPAIFLAGGIGITPFRSILLDAREKDFPQAIYLFYANRDMESAAFFNELDAIQHENFHFIPVFSQEKGKYEQGRITIDVIKKYASDDTALFYISGTPGMVFGLSKYLEDSNISSQNIKTDDFSGY